MARRGAPVGDREHGTFDRLVRRHPEPEVGGETPMFVDEGGRSGPVTNGIGSLGPDRGGGGAPDLAGRVVPKVDHLGGRVADRVVMPRREPEEVTVLGPGIPGPPLADDEAAGLVGDHVDPGRGWKLVALDPNLVIAGGGEPSVAVVEGERGRIAGD